MLARQVAVDRLRAAGCVYAEDEARLLVEAAGDDGTVLERLLARRCSGEPLELVVGFVEFGGVRVLTCPGVFVPRQRTAGLVALAARRLDLQLLNHQRPGGPAVVVDLGCGSGALLAALLAPPHQRQVVAYALDNDPVAVACARRNLDPLGATVLLSDYFGSLAPGLRGRIDLVLANLPYVPSAAIAHMAREARLYEPANALDGGPDGLNPLRSALQAATRWLAPGGSYLCELSGGQLDAAAAAAADAGCSFEASVDPDDDGALVVVTSPIQPS